MSMFTLAISCLTTSNLPWFMDLTFQVPMQYCSLEHWTLLPSPVTSRTGYCFCFGSVPSFFLELFLHWSPVAYWAPTDLGSSLSVSYPFAFNLSQNQVCHSLLQWTTFCQNSPLWPICLGWPCTEWLIALLSYLSPFVMTRLRSMKGYTYPTTAVPCPDICSKEIKTYVHTKALFIICKL